MKQKQKKQQKLVIFDIDQTLIDVIKFHDKAYGRTLKEVYGVVGGSLFDIDFPGKTLKQTMAEIAELKGIKKAAVKKNIKKALESYQKNLAKCLPKKIGKRILPGVRNLLIELKKNCYVLGIMTGNTKTTGKNILKNAGLYKYFSVFAYGGDTTKRSMGLLGVALKQAKIINKKGLKGEDIVVIGDSIRDVRAGKPYKTKTIAVQTGYHSRKKLAKEKPDYIFKNLKNYKKVLEAING